jgi:PPM family protein phosphatase
MNLGQVVSVSDTGRKRRHNEDSYVCEPPLFAIADGMGGAQAGEVASDLAASALQEHADGPETGEKRVVALIQEANRRVFERASEDASLSGMGTTLTLAVVEEGHVSLGHVAMESSSRSPRIIRSSPS